MLKRVLSVFSVVLVLAMIITPISSAEVLPDGVVPTQVTAVAESGKQDGDMYFLAVDSQGNMLTQEEVKGLDTYWWIIKYKLVITLTFWNVGNIKEDSYGTGEMKIERVVVDKGTLITHDKDQWGNFINNKSEPATTLPPIDALLAPSIYPIAFSGGPNGEFSKSAEQGVASLSGNLSNGISLTGIWDGEKVWDRAFTFSFTSVTPQNAFDGWNTDVGTRFSSIDGQVEFMHEGGDWMFAKLDSVLLTEDHVKTGEDSMAVIGFSDLSTFVLKSESEIILSTPPQQKSKVQLVYGKFMSNVKKMMKDGEIEIETTQAVCGIKGTVFSVEIVEGKTVLEVLEGKVEFTCKATGEKTYVESGQTASADTELSAVTTFDKNANKADWDKLTTAANTTDTEKAESGGETSYLWPVLTGAGLASVLVIVFLILVTKKKKNKQLKVPQTQNIVPPQAPAAVPNAPSFCKNCGAKINAGVSFCENCGNKPD